MTRLSFFAVCLITLMLSGLAFAQDSDANAQGGAGQRGKGGALKRMDANNAGKISRDEWKGKPEGFAKLDKDGDGSLTREELSARRNRMKEMDANNDGKISREEWKGRPKQFTKLDTNNDGELTREELRARRANKQ
jgi:Ca2+-binding EF-hand superfamily protein